MTGRGSTAVALVRDLDSVAGDVAAAGTKAATLGALKAAGMPVPDGFVVDASAYREFVSATRLDRLIADRLAGLDASDEGARRQAAADIRVGMVATPLPPEMRDAILDAYGDVSGPGPPATVAVRSSADTRDAVSHMLAHGNDTFLSVRGASAVLDAVRGCWASLYSERALRLRDDLGIGVDAELDVAVLVQRQVFATRAGLLSTGERASGPALLDDEVRMLARLGAQVEERLGAAQVVEWAIDRARKAWILQSTPLSVGSTDAHLKERE